MKCLHEKVAVKMTFWRKNKAKTEIKLMSNKSCCEEPYSKLLVWTVISIMYRRPQWIKTDDCRRKWKYRAESVSHCGAAFHPEMLGYFFNWYISLFSAIWRIPFRNNFMFLIVFYATDDLKYTANLVNVHLHRNRWLPPHTHTHRWNPRITRKLHIVDGPIHLPHPTNIKKNI